MRRDQFRALLEEAADELEARRALDPPLLSLAVKVLRAVANDRPLPNVQDPRGRGTALDPYETLWEICEAQNRRGGPEHFHHAVREVAARHEVNERAVRRALERTDMDDKLLELLVLTRKLWTK